TLSPRALLARDAGVFLLLLGRSRSLHEPWISPPLTRRAFDTYLTRTSQDDHEGLLICRRDSSGIVGVINLDNIVRGSFLSASLGYSVRCPDAGRGVLRD